MEAQNWKVRGTESGTLLVIKIKSEKTQNCSKQYKNSLNRKVVNCKSKNERLKCKTSNFIFFSLSLSLYIFFYITSNFGQILTVALEVAVYVRDFKLNISKTVF